MANAPLFLGLELATDQLRASLVDDTLRLVGSECIDFDADLPEYQTQGGIFTTPGDAYTTPVEMWIKALDLLFDKLRANWELNRIKSIGGCAQHALVYWRSAPLPALPTLPPNVPLHRHFPSSSFSLPHTPTPSDSSSHPHALYIQSLLGGRDAMVRRVGLCASPGLKAGELLRVRLGEGLPHLHNNGPINLGLGGEGDGGEVWKRTGRIQVASAFLASLISGRWVSMREEEAVAMGMWVHQPAGASHWDDQILEIIGGSREEGRRVRGWLGEVDISGGSRKVGNISRYLVDRFGFDPETIVAPFTSDTLASYLSLLPSPSDAVLAFGPMDLMMAPAHTYIPDAGYVLLPHPAQDLTTEGRKYVLVFTSRNADVCRALVRDMYTKSWSAFDRLVAIVPPGGSIGLDDKLFSYFRLQAETYTFPSIPRPPYVPTTAHASRERDREMEPVKGIFRFETGVKVTEFRDLRANPRCLIESQILAFRVRWGMVKAIGVLTEKKVVEEPGSRNASRGPSPLPSPRASPMARPTTHAPANPYSSLGLPFDPYSPTPLPSRIIATGAAANFPSIVNLVGDVFCSGVYVPQTQVEQAQVAPYRNALTARGATGGAWIAKWVFGRERANVGPFEDDAKKTLIRRSQTTASKPAVPPTTRAGLGINLRSSGLGASVLIESDAEDEAERLEEMDEVGDIAVGVGRLSGYSSQTSGYAGYIGPYADPAGNRIRTTTSSTMSSDSSLHPSPSTAFTTPDVGFPTGSSGTSINPAENPAGTGTTTLTPIAPLPTSDAEVQLGWTKVAEPDVDAFMCYASIVPEFCRLESGLARASLS